MISNALENLYYRKYRINFWVTNPFIMPNYHFSLFRGVFGKNLKDSVCSYTELIVCNQCKHSNNCPYTAIFKVKLDSSHPLYRKYSEPPVPYILYPSVTPNKKYLKGDSFSVELTLIGNAIEYDTFLLQMIQMIPADIGKMYNKFECSGIETQIGDNKKSNLKFNTQPENTNIVKLVFNSPLMLEIKKKPANNMPFDVLINRLNERVELLNYFYCRGEIPQLNLTPNTYANIELEDNFKETSWFRKEGKSGSKVTMSGLMGYVDYIGELEQFIPLIRAGEVLHVGRYTNYGLGNYSIKFNN